MKVVMMVAAIAVLAAPLAVRAQEDAVPQAPGAWGTRFSSVATASAWSFIGPLTDAGNGFRRCQASTEVCRAAFDLVGGSMAWSLGLEACDTSPTTEIVARLWVCEEAPGSCTIAAESHTGLAATPGCGHFWETVQPYVAVRNWHFTYLVDVFGSDGAANVPADFRAVRIATVRELGQGPAVPAFSDVPPTHPYYRYIQLLSESLITGGCGNGQFCPDRAISRGEAAVLLVEALGMTLFE
jgi:hypothetical protein